jgi:hypothetical protein
MISVIFQNVLKIPGLDMAYWQNSWKYHTKLGTKKAK